MTKSKKINSVGIIFKRELAGYFTSPVAYIVCGLFLIFMGFAFFSTFFAINRAELRGFFELLPVMFSFFIPALTMRVFSEEKRSGSFETLDTLPVTTEKIVTGKYLASLVSACVMLVPTLVYVVSCSFLGNLDLGPVVGGYLGAVLLAAAFTAVGIFASSITKNQIVAFFVALAICMALTMIDYFSILIPGNMLGLVTFLSARSHFNSISRGIIDTRDLIYFISIAALFIVFTVRVLKNSKRG